MRTAAEKLHCIEETSKIIANSYMLMSKNQKPATADDLSPLMILVLIMAAPKRLISSIKYSSFYTVSLSRLRVLRSSFLSKVTVWHNSKVLCTSAIQSAPRRFVSLKTKLPTISSLIEKYMKSKFTMEFILCLEEERTRHRPRRKNWSIWKNTSRRLI